MQALHTIENEMPWDEAENDVLRETDIATTETTRWRRYGQARRRELLENDRRKGGTKFNLNSSCSIHRYFQVAHRALEQFHKMYNGAADVEETYIMGHRMISFLTECLPKHPHFRRPGVADLRRHSRQELELLRKRLEEVALQIDEEQCNRFVAEFDPILDDNDSDAEDDSVSATPSKDWVAFGSWQEDEQRKADSPASDTVATTGTGSVEPFDLSSSDESASADAERQLDFSDYEEATPKPIFTMDLSTDFLDRIAKEEVCFETDSEAADSWMQDNESVAPSGSSGTAITCDPARLAFRELLNRVPTRNLLSPTNGKERSRATKPPRRPDPPVQESKESEACPVEFEIQRYLQAEDPASTVEHEIQRYLDSSMEADPDAIFKLSMEKLKGTSPARSFATSHSSSPSSALQSYTRTEKENAFAEALPDHDWVSF